MGQHRQQLRNGAQASVQLHGARLTGGSALSVGGTRAKWAERASAAGSVWAVGAGLLGRARNLGWTERWPRGREKELDWSTGLLGCLGWNSGFFPFLFLFLFFFLTPIKSI